MRKLQNADLISISGGVNMCSRINYNSMNYYSNGSSYNDVLFSSSKSTPEIVITASRASNLEDALLGAALKTASRGAFGALGEGITIGLGAGSWLGPAGAVAGAAIGTYIAYKALY